MPAEQTPADDELHKLHSLRLDTLRLRRQFRRFWRLPEGLRLATPAFSGIFLLTMTSLGVTAASWVLVRLLPNRELVSSLTTQLPGGILGLLGRLSSLLEGAAPSTLLVSGALVSQEAYIITYACGAATVFCFLLLLVAFIRKW